MDDSKPSSPKARPRCARGALFEHRKQAPQLLVGWLAPVFAKLECLGMLYFRGALGSVPFLERMPDRGIRLRTVRLRQPFFPLLWIGGHLG
jgi:hypothetical protein